MGRSTTPTYIVRIATRQSRAGSVGHTAMAWSCKHCGRPTAANLAKWVHDLEASQMPGGCNAHLGADPVTSAAIYRNGSDTVVARYGR